MSIIKLSLDNDNLDRDDIPTNEDYVDLTTNQTVSGIKTFANSIVLPNGSTSNPSFSFLGDPDSGPYSIGDGNVGFSANGTLRWDYNTSRINSAIPIILPSGSAAAPAVGVGSSNTGVYSASAGGFLNFAINGTNRLEITSARIDTSLPVWIPNGSAAAPSLSFTNDAGNNTGLYLVGADQVGFSSGGTLRWDYSTSRISSTIPIRITNGTAAVPSVTFSTSDIDTGLYSSGDGAVEISSNAGRVMRVDEGSQLFYARTGGVERFLFNSNTTAGDVFQAYQTRGSTAAYFFYSTAGTFGTVSDRKLKKNIQDVQISKASQLVKLMNPKKYEWKESEDSSEVVNGFIAQDLKEAVLEVGEFERLISEDSQGTLRVAHDQMLVVLAGGLRDALERIEVLEAEIKLKRDK